MDDSIDLKSDKEDTMLFYKKMSNIKEFRRNMKDELALLLNLSLNLMKFKPVYFMIVLITCQYSFTLFLTIHHLLSTFDKHSLLQYGSFAGMEIFILTNLWTILSKYPVMSRFVVIFKESIMPIDKDLLGEKKYKSIMLTCLLLKISAVANYGLAIAAAFGICISPEYYNSRTYTSFWIRENFKNYSEHILFFVHMSTFPVAITLTSLSIVMSYLCARGLFQITSVNKIIEGICDSTLHPTQRYDSSIYQAVVLQKLKICIMAHQLCIRLTLLSSEIFNASLISITGGGVILGGSLLIEFLTHDISEMSKEYFAIICFSLSGIVTSVLYGSAGQFVKDESEKTYDVLVNLPWYYMNEENKRIYSIFLRRASIPISVTNNLVEVNYILLVRLFKSIYSSATLLSQFVAATSSGNV